LGIIGDDRSPSPLAPEETKRLIDSQTDLIVFDRFKGDCHDSSIACFASSVSRAGGGRRGGRLGFSGSAPRGLAE
jgi:hypothetical protein